MSGTVPPPPPPGPASPQPGAERSQVPRQAPPSFAPGGARPGSAASPASPSTAASPAPARDPHATQVHQNLHAPVPPAPGSVASPSAASPGYPPAQATAAYPPAPTAAYPPAQATAAYPPGSATYPPRSTTPPAQATAAMAPVAPAAGSYPPAAQQTAAVPPPAPATHRSAPARQPVYSQPAPQAPGYGYTPEQHAYAQPSAHGAGAPQGGPATTQNPAVGRSRGRRLSPGWLAFIAVDVVLLVVALVFVVQALTGPDVPSVSTPSDTPAAAAEGDGQDQGEAEAVAFGAQVAELRSPSRNISCQIFEAGVSCGIAELNQRPAPVEGCDGSSGYVVTLDSVGDVALPCVDSKPKKAPKKLDELAYGESVTEGDFTCTSEQDGMYCRHDPSGNGFSLARAGIGATS